MGGEGTSTQSVGLRAAKFASALLVVVGALGIVTELTSHENTVDDGAQTNAHSMACPGGYYCPSGVSVSFSSKTFIYEPWWTTYAIAAMSFFAIF